MKKALMIIAHQQFRDEEYKNPRKVLEQNKFEVTVASSSTDTATGALGMKVSPDIKIGDVKTADYDVIVFVGGAGSEEYFNSPLAHKIVREAVAQNKILGAICIAPATLANAGVLTGKKATCYPSVNKDLKAKGAIVTGKSVEKDGKIITANGPAAAFEFGKALVEA